jgi:hypothetical protein
MPGEAHRLALDDCFPPATDVRRKLSTDSKMLEGKRLAV